MVIDCGANYADLWLILKNYIDEKNYITFESGKGEFASICLNAAHSSHHNEGLGIVNSANKFYVYERSADSSFVEPPVYEDIIMAKTVTLDSFVTDNGLKSIKLLKIEAEGFEPEILEGAKNILPIIEYVAIDGGYERGLSQDETFSFQTNFLIKFGFEMIGVNLRYARALFRRVKEPLE